MDAAEDIINQYKMVRGHTELLCEDLAIEDYIPQPITDVSPPKWHLAHTAWFFEQFILKKCNQDYSEYNPQYCFLFNSYYEAVGERVNRCERGFLSRPTVSEVYAYRKHVDKHMIQLLEQSTPNDELRSLLILGLNHEQQHQELLITDIKYILGHNPIHPSVKIPLLLDNFCVPLDPVIIGQGNYSIGYQGKGFCFDNELKNHTVYVDDYKISADLITNGEYLEFIKDNGYQRFEFWHDEGWNHIKTNNIIAPEYWLKIGDEWHNYTFSGLKPIKLDEPVSHISFYEASAYAAWRGSRLPTEFEWEIAAPHFNWGSRWEWTSSAYLPYPGFSRKPGAIGEYNGKFMVNQMVLRGASIATSPQHSRITYRNFFYPNARWQYTGIRLIA